MKRHRIECLLQKENQLYLNFEPSFNIFWYVLYIFNIFEQSGYS